MREKLSDVTFIIPIRLETVVRLENLLLSIKYIQKYFSTNILVLEAAEYNNGFIKKLVGKQVKYHFEEDRDSVFYRTKYLNLMTDMATSAYLAIWDSDVIIPKEQIIYAIKKLRDNTVDMIYPYDGHFYDTSDPIRELYIKTKNEKVLFRNVLKMDLPYGSNMVGGAFMVNKNSYIESGKENEDFYGWGPEDGERFFRWRNIGMRVEHGIGNLYHLSHPRGMNSGFRSENQRSHTLKELSRMEQSSKEEILTHLRNKNRKDI
ncbi:MAG: hypothetical protein BGN96_05805 [Bacteroidales bacterium 45-6]|uniref:galactosyltransferase-related protein n=1 Tax=uncultured Dysgonomonas sp. TaxID=206096 RepID=UPI00095BDE79|nr:galactosyltransferase-related protein [uncultured Dysgonomonas sp.]OJU47702.1 MAG: hypothetical protein BGN96_05805 [Bacteroidales bacterium 45-6]